MATLSCGVRECAHNKENHCCNQSIMVGGKKANRASQTMCKDFDEQNSAMTSSSIKREINLNMEIGCSAVNCIHNEGERCVSSYVNISGDNCYSSDDTMCKSFTER